MRQERFDPELNRNIFMKLIQFWRLSQADKEGLVQVKKQMLDRLVISIYHYENMPMQYTEIFEVVRKDFQQIIYIYFSYFSSKHRLWVHIRTAPVLLYKSGV